MPSQKPRGGAAGRERPCPPSPPLASKNLLKPFCTKRTHARRAVAHAEQAASSLKSQEAVQQGVGGLSLAEAKDSADAQRHAYLAEQLEVWESFAGQPGAKAPRIYRVPFAMQVRREGGKSLGGGTGRATGRGGGQGGQGAASTKRTTERRKGAAGAQAPHI